MKAGNKFIARAARHDIIFVMPTEPKISDLTTEELRVRAMKYRELAKSETSERLIAAVNRLADHFEQLARDRGTG